jgi:hypothetical protein
MSQAIIKTGVVWVPADFGHPPLYKVPNHKGNTDITGLDVLVAQPNGQGKFLTRVATFTKEGKFLIPGKDKHHGDEQIFPTLWAYIPVPDYQKWIEE